MKSRRSQRIVLLFGLLQFMVLVGMSSIIGSAYDLGAHQQFVVVFLFMGYCIASGVGFYSFYQLKQMGNLDDTHSEHLEVYNENTLRQLKEIQRMISDGKHVYAAKYINAVAAAKKIQDRVEEGKTLEELLLAEYVQIAHESGIGFSFECACENMNRYISYKEYSSLVGNLLDNALRALTSVDSNKDRWVNLRIGFCRLEDTSRFMIEVSNSHQTLSQEHADVILEPGYTTKKEKGHGFGMSIIQDIVNEKNGVLVIETEPHTRFRVLFPTV